MEQEELKKMEAGLILPQAPRQATGNKIELVPGAFTYEIREHVSCGVAVSNR